MEGALTRFAPPQPLRTVPGELLGVRPEPLAAAHFGDPPQSLRASARGSMQALLRVQTC